MVKFGEIVKVTEARKPKSSPVRIKYKPGAMLKKVRLILEEHPGSGAKQIGKLLYPMDPRSEQKAASWLYTEIMKDSGYIKRRKLDGRYRYYLGNYKVPGISQEPKETKPEGTIASGVLSESLAQALFNYYAANKEPNLQGFIKYLKDLEG